MKNGDYVLLKNSYVKSSGIRKKDAVLFTKNPGVVVENSNNGTLGTVRLINNHHWAINKEWIIVLSKEKYPEYFL